MAHRDGAGWSQSYVFGVPPTWSSGLYAARFYDPSGRSFYVTFVVREPVVGTAPIAVLASSNTWTAYNSWAWGSKSAYGYVPPDASGRRLASVLSMARPNSRASPTATGSHLAGGERHILEWLEREGFSYGMIAGPDLDANPGLLSGYSTLVISTHSEYWSARMYDHLEAFLNQGGTLLYLSGNGIYWKSTIQGDEIETRKDEAAHTHDGTPGGLWASAQVNRNEAAVIGVHYTSVGYCTSGPYEIFDPHHWVFEGTGVQAGSLIGASGRTGSCNSANGASGWETDKIIAGVSPSNLVHLGKGTNPQDRNTAPNNPPSADVGGADLLYYRHPGGGSVFSVGSINFGRSLVVDPTLSRMVRNVLVRAPLTRRAHPVTSIGGTPGTCNASCVSTIQSEDGARIQWLACSPAYGYGTPSDLRFTVPEHASVQAAQLKLVTSASGSDARATISCVNGNGTTLATLLPSYRFPTAMQTYEWGVPPVCFGDSTVRIRVTRNGGNCLGPDYAELVTFAP